MLKCLYMVQNANQECNLQDISASTSALQWLKNWIMITVLDNRLCIIYNIAFVKRRLIKIHLAFSNRPNPRIVGIKQDKCIINLLTSR